MNNGQELVTSQANAGESVTGAIRHLEEQLKELGLEMVWGHMRIRGMSTPSFIGFSSEEAKALQKTFEEAGMTFEKTEKSVLYHTTNMKTASKFGISFEFQPNASDQLLALKEQQAELAEKIAALEGGEAAC
jgi:hypothetical protein